MRQQMEPYQPGTSLPRLFPLRQEIKHQLKITDARTLVQCLLKIVEQARGDGLDHFLFAREVVGHRPGGAAKVLGDSSERGSRIPIVSNHVTSGLDQLSALSHVIACRAPPLFGWVCSFFRSGSQ